MFFLVDHLTLKEIRWRPCLMQHFIFFEYYIIITFLAKQHKCSCPSTWHWVKEQMPGVAGSTTTARYHFVVVYIHSQVLQTCMSYIMLQPCQAFFFLAVCDLLGKFAFSSLPLLYRMYSANTILKISTQSTADSEPYFGKWLNSHSLSPQPQTHTFQWLCLEPPLGKGIFKSTLAPKSSQCKIQHGLATICTNTGVCWKCFFRAKE